MPATPSKNSASDGQIVENFSASELKFIVTLLSNLNGKLDPNWDAVAAATGMKKKSTSLPPPLLSTRFHPTILPSLPIPTSSLSLQPTPSPYHILVLTGTRRHRALARDAP